MILCANQFIIYETEIKIHNAHPQDPKLRTHKNKTTTRQVGKSNKSTRTLKQTPDMHVRLFVVSQSLRDLVCILSKRKNPEEQECQGVWRLKFNPNPQPRIEHKFSEQSTCLILKASS